MTDREIEARLAAAREWADYVGKPGLMAYGQSVAKDVWELIKAVEFLLEERKSRAASAAAPTGKKKRRAARPPAPVGEAWGTGLNPTIGAER